MKNKQGRGKREEGGIGRKGKEEKEKREEYLWERKCEEWGGGSHTKLPLAKTMGTMRVREGRKRGERAREEREREGEGE